MKTTASTDRIGPRLVAATLIAIGTLVASVTIMVWGIGLYETSQHRRRVYESIIVRPDGQPVIQSYASGEYQNMSYRTLTGEQLDSQDVGQLGSAQLWPPVEPPPLFNWPEGWGTTLGASDSAKPRGAWYLVRNGEPSGQAYFVGYDSVSRLPIGYLGRDGFRRSPPPESEWFDIGLRPLGYGGGGAAASVQQLSYNGVANLYDYGVDRDDLRPWKLFVIDADRVVEVDLQARLVRALVEVPGITSIGMVTEAVEQPEGEPVSARDRRYVHRLAIRSQDRIIILHPDDGVKHEFPIPESLRSLALQVYSPPGEQLILEWHEEEEAASEQQLTWLAADGEIEREETVTLARSGDTFGAKAASLVCSAGAPVPLVWAAFMTGIAPVGMYQSHQVPSYAAGVAKTLEMGWPGLLVVLGVGCLSAFVVWRWQKRYHRDSTGAWCVFAFLFGLTGMVAYWLENRAARVDACGECGANVPRDRDACAACAAPFATPALVGTEIFA